MSFPLTPQQISSVLETPLINTTNNWQLLETALNQQGIGSDAVCIAALATVKVECPRFYPVHEYGSSAYLQQHYEGRADLGNTQSGDGILFAGRGFVQITGRSNYRKYGQRLGLDLETYPERALGPSIAANILALYFKDHDIAAAAESGNWVHVRQLVNGGTNALAAFLAAVQTLLSIMPPPPAQETTANQGIVQQLRNMLHF